MIAVRPRRQAVPAVPRSSRRATRPSRRPSTPTSGWPKPSVAIRYLVAAAAVWLWRRRRPLLIGAVLLVVGWALLVVVDRSVGGIIHRHRQGELIGDLATARESVSPGDALGVLQIPAIGLNEVVVQGDTPGLLRGGPGHRASTPTPGERGNAVILGHRTRYGGPFGDLSDLSPNDEIVFQVKNAKYPTSYRVVSVSRVPASGDDVLRWSPAFQMTLVTSAGGLFPGDRIVVVATADGRPPPERDPTLARTVSEVGFNGRRGSVFLNSTMAMAYLAAIGLWITVDEMAGFRRRARLLAMAPSIALIAYCLLANLDLILATTA